MADSDEIFVRSAEPLDVFAERVACVLGMEFMRAMRSDTGKLSYRMRARTFEDWIGVFVGPGGRTFVRAVSRLGKFFGSCVMKLCGVRHSCEPIPQGSGSDRCEAEFFGIADGNVPAG